MLKSVLILVCAAMAAAAVEAQQLPNLSGNYRCQPEPSPCKNGQTFTVTQTGDKIDFKDEKGEAGEAKLTSNISLSAGAPWNMLGTVTSGGAIQWSNGTQWRKQ